MCQYTFFITKIYRDQNPIPGWGLQNSGVSMQFDFEHGHLREFSGFSVLINGDLLPIDRDEGYYQGFFDYRKIASDPDTKIVRGRGETYIYRHDGRRLVLREYLRGGLFGKFVRRSYLAFFRKSYRAFQEFELLRLLRLYNLHVPMPVLARVKYKFPFVYNEIVLQEIERCRNLDEILLSRALSPREIANIKEQIAALFKFRIVHTDLNIRNVLVDDREEAYIVDFDKCYVKDEFRQEDRLRMVDRMMRSFYKQKELYSEAHKKYFYNEELVNEIVSLADDL